MDESMSIEHKLMKHTVKLRKKISNEPINEISEAEKEKLNSNLNEGQIKDFLFNFYSKIQV